LEGQNLGPGRINGKVGFSPLFLAGQQGSNCFFFGLQKRFQRLGLDRRSLGNFGHFFKTAVRGKTVVAPGLDGGLHHRQQAAKCQGPIFSHVNVSSCHPGEAPGGAVIGPHRMNRWIIANAQWLENGLKKWRINTGDDVFFALAFTAAGCARRLGLRHLCARRWAEQPAVAFAGGRYGGAGSA
jgi:hypothetical protein